MSPFPGRTGRGVRVAVIDSGVHLGHPHIGPVAGGAEFGTSTGDFADRIGHGTAVMAAIQEKAPDAAYYALKVFHKALRTRIEHLAEAIEWCLREEIHVVNLSLGTTNQDHAPLFRALLDRAELQGMLMVSAVEAGGLPALPGTLAGTIGVGVSAGCPRDRFLWDCVQGFRASPYPRPVPGVPAERNLAGISFAVANLTGFAVRGREECGGIVGLREALEKTGTGEPDRRG